MEKIISFFMNNLFFVVIIVGIIASLFRKSPLEKRNPRMPDFGGGGNPMPQRPRPPIRPPEQPSRPRPPQPAQHTEPERRETPLEKPRPTVYRTEPLPAKPEPRPVHVAEEPLPRFVVEEAEPAAVRRQAPAAAVVSSVRTSADDGELTRDDVARAIVWAEILGPPRARRPYRR